MSDPDGRVALPLEVLDAGQGLPRRVGAIISEHDVSLVVVGLPLTLGGDEGHQAAEVRRAATELATYINVPVVYHDERLTSVEANRAMAPSASSRKRRGRVDMVAAAMLLQSFLETRRTTDMADDPREHDDDQS